MLCIIDNGEGAKELYSQIYWSHTVPSAHGQEQPTSPLETLAMFGNEQKGYFLREISPCKVTLSGAIRHVHFVLPDYTLTFQLPIIENDIGPTDIGHFFPGIL